jgi:hypothetical protein
MLNQLKFALNLLKKMNNTYLAHIVLPDELNLSFYALIPKQRMVVNALMKENVIVSYSLDMDRKNVWVFIKAQTEPEVMDVLSTFPIIKYVKVNIHELAFHDAAHLALPELIMN